MTKQPVIAYWLMPSEPARRFFQRIIDDLARRYDAPVFEPHVTVHVGADRADGANTTLRDAANQCEPIALAPLGIEQSDEFIKTLFLQFSMSAELRKISGIVRESANDSSHYELKPHLSLLYKRMPATARRELATSINVPHSEVTFDAMKAMHCVSPTESRVDVEAWRVLGQTVLPSFRAQRSGVEESREVT